MSQRENQLLQQNLELEEYNQETLYLVDELIKGFSQLSPTEKTQKLNTILFRCKHMDSLDLEVVRDTLVESKLTSKRAFNAKTKELKSGENENGNNKVLYVARFPGLVDIVRNHKGEPGFMVLKEKDLELIYQFEEGNNVYVPPPKRKIPFLLPRASEVLTHYEQDNDLVLYENLLTYLREVSELPEDGHYHLLATWVIHTYLLEKFNFSPEIVFYSTLPEKGKSRTGKAMVNLAYRGHTLESLREAFIFRYSRDFGGSLFFDCMDLWKKVEKNQCEDIILNRYERGCQVPRVLYPDRGSFNDTEYFDIFGSTVIATNEPIHNILETRSIQIIMHKTFTKFENDVTPEVALPLKERLVAFRARHLNERLPDLKKPFEGRFGDITKPLFQIVRLARPEYEDKLLSLCRGILESKIVGKMDTIEHQILEAILSLEDEIYEGFLSTQAITEKVNKDIPEKWQRGTRSIGRKISGLGFKLSSTKFSNKRGFKIDCQTLLRLLAEYDEKNMRLYTQEKCPKCPKCPLCNVFNELSKDIKRTFEAPWKKTEEKRPTVTNGNHREKDVRDVKDVFSENVNRRNIDEEFGEQSSLMEFEI